MRAILTLLMLMIASEAWAECGKLCDYDWWKTATEADVQAELDAGVDVMARDKYGDTPLQTSWRGIRMARPRCMKLLSLAPLQTSKLYWQLVQMSWRGMSLAEPRCTGLLNAFIFAGLVLFDIAFTPFDYHHNRGVWWQSFDKAFF